MFPRPKPSVQLIALNSRHIKINNLQLLRLGIEVKKIYFLLFLEPCNLFPDSKRDKM